MRRKQFYYISRSEQCDHDFTSDDDDGDDDEKIDIDYVRGNCYGRFDDIPISLSE